MIPKIEFKYSWIYDQNWKEWIKVYKRKKRKYPEMKEILSYKKRLEDLWKKHEKVILNEMSKTIHLPWSDKKITCYIVGRCIPFSDPLTLPVYRKIDNGLDVLTHELIHQLFTQPANHERTKR